MALKLIGLAGCALALLAIVAASRRGGRKPTKAGGDAPPYAVDTSSGECGSSDGGGCGD